MQVQPGYARWTIYLRCLTLTQFQTLCRSAVCLGRILNVLPPLFFLGLGYAGTGGVHK